MDDLNIFHFVPAPVLRFSRVAVVLPWRLLAVMSPSFPAVAWLNAGWSPVGGWDGSSSMTGMIYLDPR